MSLVKVKMRCANNPANIINVEVEENDPRIEFVVPLDMPKAPFFAQEGYWRFKDDRKAS